MKNEVSAYHLILPEAELSTNDLERIDKIDKTMEEYLENGVFKVYENSYIYVERKLNNGTIRKGIVGVIDLEEYDYTETANTGIRATEKTVVERLPIRVKIRENAVLELPHVLLLCDDPKHQLLESIERVKERLPVLYDFDLMQEGGHITGWLVSGKEAFLFDNALEEYIQETEKKYQISGKVLFYARKYRLQGLGYGLCENRRRYLLGPVVPGVRALHGAAGRRAAVLPDGYRLRADSRLRFHAALAALHAGSRGSEHYAADRGKPHRHRDRQADRG